MPTRTLVPVLSQSLHFRALAVFLRSVLFPRGIHCSWALVLDDRLTGNLTSLKFRSRHQGHLRGEASALGVPHGVQELSPGVLEMPSLRLNLH